MGYFGGEMARFSWYPSLNDSILIILWRLAFKAEQVHFILVT